MDSKETKLLIVDDEEATLFAFKDVFTEPGVSVDTAASLDETRALLERTTYDGAVVDLRLGGSNDYEGFAAIKLLKDSNPGCKIILLTAYANLYTQNKAYTEGAHHFKEKPASPEEIRTIFKSLGVF